MSPPGPILTFDGGMLDGCIHLLINGRDVVRGPLGVALYLILAPGYWFMPARHRAVYLAASSLLLAALTLGPAYAITLAVMTAGALAVIRATGTPQRRWLGTAVLAAGLAVVLGRPDLPWLPPLPPAEPVFFYAHWAGLAYLFIRAYQVLADTASGRLVDVKTADFWAFMLLAPTLRMGPIYRYQEFHRQMENGPRHHRDLPGAGVRLATAMLRLGIMAVVLSRLRLEEVYADPGSFGTLHLLAAVYLGPIMFFLWMSGYVDLCVAVGRVTGLAVPDNFNYPWKASNIADFWQRWHITLSQWLRDYMFMPMVRSRWPAALSFILTFGFCGLWHGPRACFVVWGLLQGAALATRRLWVDHWKFRRTRGGRFYALLRSTGLAGGPAGWLLAWLVTFHFLVLSITLAMDFQHAGVRLYGELLARAWGR